MKFIIPLLFVPLLTGCLNFTATQTYWDDNLQAGVTNSVKVSGLFSKSTIEKIDVASRTKSTSKLVSARGAESSGDADMVNAIGSQVRGAFLDGAKTAVKP